MSRPGSGLAGSVEGNQDQGCTDQIRRRVAPILGIEPSLLIGEIGGDDDRGPYETRRVVGIEAHISLPVCIAGSIVAFRPALPRPADPI
jgi:hypothetical protein